MGGPGAHGRPGGLRAAGVRADAEKRAVPAAGVRQPTVVIERGQVLQKAMRRLRLTTEDLFEQLRQKGVFYLEDVAWAIVETNGMLSVIRRPEEEPVTPKELGLSLPARGWKWWSSAMGCPCAPWGLCGKDQAWVRRRFARGGAWGRSRYS